jgi:hypothetical protein
VVLIANSNAARAPIEVCPRENLNARLVVFNTLYSDSPAKTLHVVREAVREAENVSTRVPPLVRIRNLGDNGVDYEVKYWLEDYAKYNDTDALVRQRIWYAFRRAGLNFAFPTRTVYAERPRKAAMRDGDGGAIVERLSAVDLFAPLSADETGVQILARADFDRFFRGIAVGYQHDVVRERADLYGAPTDLLDDSGVPLRSDRDHVAYLKWPVRLQRDAGKEVTERVLERETENHAEDRGSRKQRAERDVGK